MSKKILKETNPDDISSSRIVFRLPLTMRDDIADVRNQLEELLKTRVTQSFALRYVIQRGLFDVNSSAGQLAMRWEATRRMLCKGIEAGCHNTHCHVVGHDCDTRDVQEFTDF